VIARRGVEAPSRRHPWFTPKRPPARKHRLGALFDLYKTHREKAKSWTETRRIMEREVLQGGELCRPALTAGWTIPAESSKNADPHRVPLTAMVSKSSSDERLRRMSTTDTCFRTTVTPVWLRAPRKPQRSFAKVECPSNVARMTCAAPPPRTWAKPASTGSHCMLNHRSVTHSTVTAIYDRYRYDKEKRAALEKWAEVLSGIVDVKPAPTTAPAKWTQRQNVYEFQPRALRRAGDRAREDVGCPPTQSA
jgi:hypothetical protein